MNKPLIVGKGDIIINDDNEFLAEVHTTGEGATGNWVLVRGITGSGRWAEAGPAFVGQGTELRHATQEEIERFRKLELIHALS